jgi:hypothetical protein
LLNDWHVVAYVPALPERQPVAARLQKTGLKAPVFLSGG